MRPRNRQKLTALDRIPGVRGYFFLLLIVGILFGATNYAAAHAELVDASPPVDGLLVVPPRSIDLRMSESVAEGAGSPSIEVIDQQGRTLSVSDIQVNETDQARITARVSGIATGTYTVLWSVRSEVDGHTLSGSYAFRVGEGRAPGAAVVEGEAPRVWAVATRWATFLGAAIAAGSFFLVLLAGSREIGLPSRRIQKVAGMGALVALVSSILEPILISRFPPRGITGPSIGDAFPGLPNSWWCRPVAAILVIAMLAITKGRTSKINAIVGLIFSLLVIAGLSLTSHAAARSTWHETATAINMVHLFSIALWVGGLLVLTFIWRSLSSEPELRLLIVRTFSKIALPLVAISIITGLANAGFLLPSLDSLWSTDYGTLLMLKVAIIGFVIAFAARHRRMLKRAAGTLPQLFRKSLITEALLASIAIALATSLALLSPPQVESDAPKSTTIALPINDARSGRSLNVVLTLAPAKSGINSLGVSFMNQDRTTYTGTLPARVIANLSNLEFPATAGPIELTSAADGSFTREGVILGLDGWWNVDLTLRWLGEEDVVLSYYVLLPDPNVHGLDAIETPDSNSDAAALYQTGMQHMTGLHTVRYWQSMSDNKGGVAFAEHIVNDGADGSAAPGYIYRAPGRYEAYVIGTTGWMFENGVWEVLETGPMVPPSEWDDEYQNATGFRLGNTEVIDGELCQIITFVVPPTERQVVSFYAWWVGTESGNVRRDVMVSRAHYMTNNFVEFNTDLPLVLPPDAPPNPFASPAASTPGTTP